MADGALDLAWDACDQAGWDRLQAAAGLSNLEQSWAYGESLRTAQGCRVRRAVVGLDGRPFAMVQVFEKRRFLPIAPVRILRGPLWLQTGLARDQRAAVLRLIKEQFRLARRELLIWSPELPEAPDSHALMRACGARQMVTGYSTVLLDLAPPPEALHGGLHGKWRNALAAAEKSELGVRQASGGRTFEWLVEHAEVFRRRSGHLGLPAALVRGIAGATADKRDVLVLTASAGKQRVAGALLFRHGASATYSLGWSGEDGRRLRAQNLLLWHAVIELRKRGVRWFDLGGVNSAAPGVARFKLGLGGRLHTLAGTFI